MERRQTRQRPRRLLIVVSATIVVLVVVRLLTVGQPNALDSALRDGVTLAASVIIESLPFVFLGIVVSIGVQLWVPTKVIAAILPRRGMPRRAVLSLLGVIFPVCECGNVPLARGLLSRGLTVPDAATFLLAAPIINPVTIITTYQAFEWDDGILIARIAGGFVIANLVGWMLSRHPSPDALLTRGFAASCRHEGSARGPGQSRLVQAAEIFRGEVAVMVRALFVGAAVAGAIQVIVSREALAGLGGHLLWGVLAMMALAFVIAICSSVDAFFALALASTFSPGALVAFLVFGPMLDVKMMAMLRTTFTTRALALITAVVALSTLVLGLGVNQIA